MLSSANQHAVRHGKHLDGRPLTIHEREQLLNKFLPESPASTSPDASAIPTPFQSRSSSRLRSSQTKSQSMAQSTKQRRLARAMKVERRKPIRSTLWQSIYIAVYWIIHFFFSIYIRMRKGFRAARHRLRVIGFHHSRSPELIRRDIKNLSKMPKHLSVILELPKDDDKRSGLHRLLQDVGDLTAWCASVNIPLLSVYEKTGILKRCIPQVHSDISLTLNNYFSRSNRPLLSLRAPNEQAFSPPVTPPDASASSSQITVLLISEEDGRSTLVDLTKVLTTMAQKDKIQSDDITAEVVDAELTESVMNEPELLILFGPGVKLDGYPPWQVRLTEIFHVPDYTEGVNYQIFMRALNRYSGAQMRFGK